MKYVRASNGYFYKVYASGLKTRISRAEYMKKKSTQNTRGVSRRTSKSRSNSINSLETKCKAYLQKKIRENLKEFEAGKFVSRSQAIAVSYSQTLKKYPSCEQIFPRRI